jgi:siroheme synthase
VLVAEGIRVDVVPGITAATGCAAYAGFPLTHRDHASSVVFVSGHSKDGLSDLDWRALANPRQTVVGLHGRQRSGRGRRQADRSRSRRLDAGRDRGETARAGTSA